MNPRPVVCLEVTQGVHWLVHSFSRYVLSVFSEPRFGLEVGHTRENPKGPSLPSWSSRSKGRQNSIRHTQGFSGDPGGKERLQGEHPMAEPTLPQEVVGERAELRLEGPDKFPRNVKHPEVPRPSMFPCKGSA